MTPSTSAAARRDSGDRAVRTARELCGRTQRLPDRSTMRGLLGFAQSTPSPEEAILFVRYQATRQQGGGMRGHQGRFLAGVADEIERNWSADIDETRRFLGILVRAAIVADEENRQRRGPQRPGQPGRPGQRGPAGRPGPRPEGGRT